MLGVNSDLGDGSHILMWDFDNRTQNEVIESLEDVQHKFFLGPINVLSTGLPCRYHAYCLTRYTWPDTLRILASTEGLDPQFFKIGTVRGFFTLRISDKQNRKFAWVKDLPGKVSSNVNPSEIRNFASYWTKRL